MTFNGIKRAAIGSYIGGHLDSSCGFIAEHGQLQRRPSAQDGGCPYFQKGPPLNFKSGTVLKTAYQ
jgi:hypothetical protein